MAKLKVFRTPAGFVDAYVAAPSRKAALAAWGAERDLFARGAAEEVTDPALTEAPLARPGEVIKVSRGDRAAQLAALPNATPKLPLKARSSKPQAPPPAPKPKPSRADLDTAEQALADAQARHERERAALAEEEAALDRRKRAMRKTQGAEQARLNEARETAEIAYIKALEEWRR